MVMTDDLQNQQQDQIDEEEAGLGAALEAIRSGADKAPDLDLGAQEPQAPTGEAQADAAQSAKENGGDAAAQAAAAAVGAAVSNADGAAGFDPSKIKGWDLIPEETRNELIQQHLTLKAERDNIENRWKAQHGQLRPAQQQLSKLQRELEERNREIAQLKSTVGDGSKSAWEEWQKRFPEDASAVQALVAPLIQQQRALQAQIEAQQSFLEDYRSRQAQEDFERQAPGVLGFVKSNADAIKHFIEMAPERQRGVIADWLESDDPNDVFAFVDTFRGWATRAGVKLKEDQAPASQSQSQVQPDPAVAQIAQRRQAAARDVVPGSRNVAAGAPGVMTEEDELGAYRAAIRAQQKR